MTAARPGLQARGQSPPVRTSKPWVTIDTEHCRGPAGGVHPGRTLLPSVAVLPPPRSRSGRSRLAAPPPGGLPLPSVARRRRCPARSVPYGPPGTRRRRPAPLRAALAPRAAAPAVPAQPSCLAAGPRRTGAAGGGAAAARRRRPEPMAYSQGGGKKKVCYYYDGEWPGSLPRGCGEGAAGGRGWWQPAGTPTRPTRRSRLGDARPPSLLSGPLGHAQVWGAPPRTGLRGTPVGTPGPDCTKPAAWSSAPRPCPLPRAPGNPSSPRSVRAALPASPGTPAPGWGCGGVAAGRGPSSQSGAVSLVFCVDSIPRLCSSCSWSSTFSGFIWKGCASPVTIKGVLSSK